MRTNKQKTFILFVVLFIMTMTLTACGGRNKPNTVSDGGIPVVRVLGQEVDIRALASKINQFRADGIEQEGNIMLLARTRDEVLNTLVLGAMEQLAIGQSCVADTGAAQAVVAEAALGNLNQEGIFNALATEDVTGGQAIGPCTEIYTNTADYIVANRGATRDANLALYEAIIAYKVFRTQYIDIDILNDLLEVYGSMPLVYEKLAEQGIEVPGTTDVTWLPTTLLEVTHGNETYCRMFTSGEFVETQLDMGTRAKFQGHETMLASMYEATWSPTLGQCTMWRAAALEWLERSTISQQAQGRIDDGDAPIFTPVEPGS